MSQHLPALQETNRSDLSDVDRAVVGLTARHAGRDASAIVAATISDEFPGRVALVSSFGSESAVLLHMVAAADPRTPVLFVDTGQLFEETLRYRDQIVDRLHLSDVRVVAPEPDVVAESDPLGTLWRLDPDRCCELRKVAVLDRALDGFDAWISGRKAYHGGLREALGPFEAADGRIKVNPLVHWDAGDIEAYIVRHDLPRHRLVLEGYPSIGCRPCTDRVRPGERVRDGRWWGSQKSECGIHVRPMVTTAR